MSYYKHDARNISLEGIDIGVLLAALYNNALTGGAGLLRYTGNDMTPDEGRHIFSELRRAWTDAVKGNEQYQAGVPTANDDGLPINYIDGVSVKAWFTWDAQERLTLSFSRYWDYNHVPVAAIVALARKGVSGRVSGQGILDVENEARILSNIVFGDAANEDAADFDNAIKRIAGTLEQNQIFYVENRSPAGAQGYARDYQISLGGNGPLRGEVGHLVMPYVKPSAP